MSSLKRHNQARGYNQPLGPLLSTTVWGSACGARQVQPGLDLGVGMGPWGLAGLVGWLWGPCGAGTLVGAVCAVVSACELWWVP